MRFGQEKSEEKETNQRKVSSRSMKPKDKSAVQKNNYSQKWTNVK